MTAQLDSASPRVSLKLIDVESGKPYFEEPKFFEINSYSQLSEALQLALDAVTGADIANIQVSPDGRYLLVAIGDRVLAYDLEQRQPVALRGKLKGQPYGSAIFLAPDQIYVVDPHFSKGLLPARTLSFPDGKVLSESQIGGQNLRAATKGQLIFIGPLKDYAVGILDPAANKVLAAWKFPAIDVWDQKVAAENSRGGLFLSALGSADSLTIPLPLGPLPVPQAGEFSRDGRYLVVSLRNRSGVWDLETGKQVRLLRPMRSLWVDDQDDIFGQLPKYLEMDATEMEITLPSTTTRDLGKYDDKEWQYGDFVYSFKPMGSGRSTGYHATLQVKKMGAQTPAWTRDYPDATPVCWPADGDRLVLAWDLGTDAAKEEVKKYPKLQEETKALTSRKKGLLIETVTPETGAPLEQVALPEVDLSRGWNDERFAQVSGEYALVRGEHGNTVIYKLDTGAKVGEFFGAPVATDSAAGLIAAANREDEILILDERTGKELQRFTLGSPIRLARIVTGKEKMLLVLTADQVVHRVPLGK
jgi:hypothetical protein